MTVYDIEVNVRPRSRDVVTSYPLAIDGIRQRTRPVCNAFVRKVEGSLTVKKHPASVTRTATIKTESTVALVPAIPGRETVRCCGVPAMA